MLLYDERKKLFTQSQSNGYEIIRTREKRKNSSCPTAEWFDFLKCGENRYT